MGWKTRSISIQETLIKHLQEIPNPSEDDKRLLKNTSAILETLKADTEVRDGITIHGGTP